MKKALTVSLIIPIYNEGRYLKACLEAIASQNHMPEEVIVVDNNSTDNPADIVKQFPFAILKTEKKQGLIPARNKGFAAATGDILARIDGDTVIGPKWVANLRLAFLNPKTGGVTGPGNSIIDPHFPNLKLPFWSWAYRHYTRSTFRFDVMWGANMALSRTAWQAVKSATAQEDLYVHEDQDLSVLVRAAGYNIAYLPNLRVTFDGYRQAYLPKALEYEKRRKKTVLLHRQQGTLQKAQQQVTLNPILAKLLWLAVLPLGLLFGLLTGVFTLECWIGLRKIPQR